MKYKSQAIWYERNKPFNTKKDDFLNKSGKVDMDTLDEDYHYTMDFDAFQLSEKITQLLTTLTEREQRIVKLYNGFDENAMSYAKIGKLENIGANRVGQIYNRALRKLRHPTRSNRIKECLTNQ